MFMENERSVWKEYSVIIGLVISLVMTYTVYNCLNLFVWDNGLNPIDSVIKPFLLFPLISLLGALTVDFSRLTYSYVKNVRFSLKRKNGSFQFKVFERTLPIYIVDNNSYLNLNLKNKNSRVVDMRINNHDNIDIETNRNIIKLSNICKQQSIRDFIEKANLIVQNTDLKDESIIFIVDSQRDRNRTISKIWLRLIRSPNSKSSNKDISTISKLVY